MTLINSIASWMLKKRMHQIELFVKYPHEVQRDVFLKLIRQAKDTEWGTRHGYNSIKDYSDYQNRVPVQDYESLKPFIERMRKGEQNILWHSEIKWFAKSSGTTSDKSKFIPLSQESLDECHFKGGKDMLSIYVNNNPDSMLFTGKSLGLSGSLRNTPGFSTAYEGDLSAVIIQNLPLLADLARTPSTEIALMENWDSKVERFADATIEENVTSLTGVPSWMLMLMKHILKKTGKSNLHEIWPNLEVFFHGGISFTPYREHFKEITDSSKMRYMETYNASEGFFGIQDLTNSNEMLLMLDYGIFYEFIPFDALMANRMDTLPLEEVKAGVEYAVIISTNGGLWRYQIGDTIRFISTNPYRFTIVGRTRNFINAFGEELMIDNAEKALQIACEKTNSSIAEYTAGPLFYESGDGGAHEWLIEFEKAPLNISLFAELLDNALKSLNSDYEAKRFNDMVLHAPVITLAPERTFYRWLESKNKLGGQFKVPRLSNNRRLLEEIKPYTLYHA
jgi:hypothetical protein